jgi:hypothetical protein
MNGPRRPALAGLSVGDAPERWEELGFSVSEGACVVGGVRVALAEGAPGITSWTLTGLAHAVDEVDGLPSRLGAPAPVDGQAHSNGAVGLDHVVVTTPDFERTADVLERLGMPLRRVRDAGGFRQGFRRLGPAILELVELRGVPPGPARFWGLVVIVPDLVALASRLGEHLGAARPAVQPGRSIATLRRSAGLSTPLAFITPDA